LEELWLGKNKLTEIKVGSACGVSHRVYNLTLAQNLSTLTNLRLLSIQSNRLATISGLSALLNLEELYVSHNALTSISGLEANTKLRVLDISNNEIDRLENLSHLTHLEELWASSNRLSSFEEVERELQGKEELQTVYFEGNPLQLRSPALYRNKVRLALPQVQQIDASKLRFERMKPEDFTDLVLPSFCQSLLSVRMFWSWLA